MDQEPDIPQISVGHRLCRVGLAVEDTLQVVAGRHDRHLTLVDK